MVASTESHSKNKKIGKKIILILSILLISYASFLIYSNVDLTPKRNYLFYDYLDLIGNKISYNTEIVEGSQPIFLERGEKAILLLHGMGGTPLELAELATYLGDRNITVFAPLLASQGRTYNEIKKLDKEEIYEEAKKYLNILKNNYREVYVGGLSTGGSLSLKLAENEELTGVISLASPITYGSDFLGDSTLGIFKTLSYLTPNLRRIEYGLAKDPSIAKKLPSFDRLPVSVLIQGELLKNEVKDKLQLIDEPILILQSRFDNRAAPSSAEYIHNNVNSKIKSITYLENSGHVITMDYDKETVFKAIYEFISEIN
jgi:carboxylesterase